MDDLISKKAAIDTLCDNCDHVEAVCPHYPCKQYIAIENLPSEEPGRKTGKWIHGKETCREICAGKVLRIEYKDWHCSNCGFVVNDCEVSEHKFCRNCGSYNGGMR